MRKSFLMMAVASAGLLVAAEAAPQAPNRSRPATIGDFAIKVSTALGYDDPMPDAAAGNLRRFGIDLGIDLGATLTEGLAARVMADLGYAVVKPLEPSAPVSETKAEFLAGTIATTGLPGVAVPEAIGLGGGSLAILQCLQSPNVGQCSQCCVALLPPRIPTGVGQQACSRVCRFNTAPASPSSPG